MKLKIDENLPAEVAVALRSDGHDADTVQEEGLVGSDDGLLLSKAQVEGRVFLTMDKGIADVRKYPPTSYSGIVLFRPASNGRLATLEFIRQHLPIVLQSDLPGHLLVVSESGIRIR